MNEEKCRHHFKVIAINESSSWESSFCQRAGGAIFGLYLYDALQQVNCCEITPSYELNLMRSIPYEWPEGDAARDALDQEIRDADAQGDSTMYRHCRSIDAIEPFYDFGEQVSDGTWDEALQAALEYCHANGVEPSHLPPPLSRRLQMAQEAFADYDFGSIEIVGDAGWDSSDSNDLTLIAYGTEPQPFAGDPDVPDREYAPDQESFRISFHVRFDKAGRLEEVCALDMKSGGELGSPRRAQAEPALTP